MGQNEKGDNFKTPFLSHIITNPPSGLRQGTAGRISCVPLRVLLPIKLRDSGRRWQAHDWISRFKFNHQASTNSHSPYCSLHLNQTHHPATNHPFGCEQRRQVPGSRVSLTSATLRLSKANSMSSPPVTEVSIKLDYGRASPVKLCLSPDTSLVFPALGEEKWAGTEGATLERLHSPTTSQHTQRAATGNGRSKILSSSRSTPQTVGLARDSRTILQSLPSRSTTKVSPKTLFLFFLSASRPNPPPCCQSSPKLTTVMTGSQEYCLLIDSFFTKASIGRYAVQPRLSSKATPRSVDSGGETSLQWQDFPLSLAVVERGPGLPLRLQERVQGGKDDDIPERGCI